MRALLILLISLIPVTAPAQTLVEVDVELVLAVDVSRSMNEEELEIQRQGYAEALTSPQVIAAIRNGLIGTIAVTYVEWAGSGMQNVIVPWTIIAGPEDAARVANTISWQITGGMRRTSISGALDAGRALIEGNQIHGLRRVIDVSGDGPNNMGPEVTAARDRALAEGIIINGIPLMTEDPFSTRWGIPDLDVYYTRCVIGGPGAFVIPVTDWRDFAEAVRRKLVLEISGLEPRIIPAQLRQEPPYDCLVGEKLWERNRQIWMEP
ncbi:DUF1194 domain-containing protein [Mesobacterium pallidum]|uniref:DUF1194 domain-containing protein n=1 Tax=Mesobacterium pallidum TaxID=2872037 RepID=UPI001EE31447|nr:DUF1194 domain-containing protein [Mesobacterium pallidum]